jgi:branched-chain amino acid transport system ATP-binding protein
VTTSDEADVVLAVDAVTLAFRGLVAIDDVSLSIRAGRVTGIVGPNGAGKSSLLNCINGFYVPQSGDIKWHGESILRKAPHQISRLGIARTFQGVELLPGLSVIENVMIGLHPRMAAGVARCAVKTPRARREENDAYARAEDVLSFLGISRFRGRMAGNLSYGDQKIVAIARALVVEPRLLLLDEPTSGMSQGEKSAIRDVVHELRRERGLTQVLIEHDVPMIRSLSDDVIVLNFGKVLAAGPPDEVFSQADVIDAFVGRRALAGS